MAGLYLLGFRSLKLLKIIVLSLDVTTITINVRSQQSGMADQVALGPNLQTGRLPDIIMLTTKREKADILKR